VHQRTAIIDRELGAEEVLTRYREPLVAVAFDLQSRVYNVLRLDFLQKFGDGHPLGEEAQDHAFSTGPVLWLDRDPAPRHPVPQLSRG
jgi:hypothetical protein